MTEDHGESKRVLDAEALLARAPLRAPDWDAFTQRIEAALATAGATDDSLLLPPLPESVEDGRLELAPAPAEVAERTAVEAAPEGPGAARESTSLAELARAAVARRGTQDAVSLAKESLAIASQKRGAAEVTAQPASARESRAAVGTPVAAVPSIVVERERRTVPPSRRARAAMDTRGPWIGVAVAAVGLAAGFGLYLSGRARTEIVEVPVAVAPASPAPPAAASVAKAPAAAERATPEVTPDTLRAERSIPPPSPAPTTLAAETVAAEGTPSKASAVRVAPSETRSSGVPSAGAVRAEKVVLDEDHAATAAASAPASRPGTTPGLKPAELNANGGVADRPSTGAAQAAVGAVLGAARSCLAGQPQGSSATLVFGSGGEVTNVSVSGPAEGTPAAACIQAALKKARVQPFAAPSFSLGVTVRPP